MIRNLIPALLIAAPVHAQFAPTAEERLRNLTAPPAVDIYGTEKNVDRARIEAEADALFGPDQSAAIAIFIGPKCPDCAQAAAELRRVTDRLDLTLSVIELDASTRPMFERLNLDSLPSYVMPDRLIRGLMPDFVLEDYLTR